MGYTRTASRRQLKVMVMGDSLGQGAAGDAESIVQGGMRNGLTRGITAHLGIPPQMVGSQFYNSGWMCGVSGLTIAALNADPYAIVQIAQYQPDVIFLHIGTNDSTQLNTGGTPLLVTSRADLTTLLNNIRTAAPRCRVYISRIIDNQTAHTEVVNFNAAAIDIDVIARADYLAGLVRIVDEYTAVGLYSVTNYANGTHLNITGHALRVPALLAAFNADY